MQKLTRNIDTRFTGVVNLYRTMNTLSQTEFIDQFYSTPASPHPETAESSQVLHSALVTGPGSTGTGSRAKIYS